MDFRTIKQNFSTIAICIYALYILIGPSFYVPEVIITAFEVFDDLIVYGVSICFLCVPAVMNYFHQREQ